MIRSAVLLMLSTSGAHAEDFCAALRSVTDQVSEARIEVALRTDALFDLDLRLEQEPTSYATVIQGIRRAADDVVRAGTGLTSALGALEDLLAAECPDLPSGPDDAANAVPNAP